MKIPIVTKHVMCQRACPVYKACYVRKVFNGCVMHRRTISLHHRRFKALQKVVGEEV